MKKVISIILCIILILVCLNVKAVSENGATVNMSFAKTVNKENIVMTLKLGEFEGVTEDSVMTVTMTLDYDENVISKVRGEDNNNWKITIQEDTKRVLLETDNAKSNTEIAKIIFEVNQEVETQTSSVGLKEINVAASTSELDEYYNDQTVNFTANEETTQTPEEDGNNIAGGNNIVNNNTTGNNVAANEANEVTLNSANSTSNKANSSKIDNTTAGTRLPDTGIRNILIIAIVIVAICIVIFKIKSRKIKY